MKPDGEGDRISANKGAVMRDVARIAAELPEAQLAICRRPFGLATHAFYPAGEHRACRAMVESGLLTERADNVGNPTFLWTPLGLSVRAHLLGGEE